MSVRNFGQEVVDTYRAWDEFSRRSNGDTEYAPEEDPNRIIDIDVAPQIATPLHFDSNKGVEAAFENLLERSQTGKKLQNGDFVERKLRASLQHLRLLAGDRIKFSERLETAMGVPAELVDEKSLDDHREALDGQLKPHGLRFDANHYEAFSEQLELRESQDETRERLLEAARWSGKTIKRYTGTQSLVMTPELSEVDQPWVGWFGTGEGGKPFFRMNAHPRHKYTPARIGAVAIHEMGHGTQLGIWKRAIGRGRMSPAMGIPTLHTPEMTQIEAYALLIEQLGLRSVRGPDSWQYRWQADYHDYRERVQHNAHIMINTGHGQAAVEDYAIERLPFTPPDAVRQDITDGQSDPALISYLACYQPGFEAVRPVLHMPFQQQRSMLARLGNQPLTLGQMRDIVTAGAEQRAA